MQGFDDNRTWRVVSEPENYGATWLLLHEVDASLAHHGLGLNTLPVVYRVIRSAMAQLVEQHGPARVRLVLWFS